MAKTTIMAGGACACLAAVLFAAMPASADSPVGEFRGFMEDRGRPVLVILQLADGVRLGGPAGRIRFQEPWACGFDLEYAGNRGKEGIYIFHGAGAGACRSFAQSYARLGMADGSIGLEIVAVSGGDRRVRLQPVRRE